MSNIATLKLRSKTVSTVLKATSAVKMITSIKLVKLKTKITQIEQEVEENLKFINMIAKYIFQEGLQNFVQQALKDIILKITLQDLQNKTTLQNAINIIENSTTSQDTSNSTAIPTNIEEISSMLHNQNLGIIIFSDKGLCGGYNTQLHRYFLSLVNQIKLKKLIIIGNKGFKYSQIYSNFGLEVINIQMSKIDMQTLIHLIIQNNGCQVIYNKYKNILEQVPTIYELKTNLVEIFESINSNKENNNEKQNISPQHILPSKQIIMDLDKEEDFSAIFELILKKYLFYQMKNIFINTNLSEQYSRLVIMDSSIENAKTLYHELQIKINKTRQDSITNQIIETVTSSSFND